MCCVDSRILMFFISDPLRLRPVAVGLRFGKPRFVGNQTNTTEYDRADCRLYSSLFTFKLVCDIRFESRWAELVRKNSLGKMSEYADSYRKWNNNPLFLYNYGAMLNAAKDHLDSNMIMAQCKACYNDYDVQMLIADNYYNLSNWDNSLEHYEVASRMCPNRFMPLYRQFVSYDYIGDSTNADSIAREIVRKPIKVPSGTISGIIRKIDEHLNKQITQ